jgi:CBS domain-containing protein
MLVKQLMDKDPAFCNQFDNMKDAAVAMKRHRIGFIPVTENEPPHAYSGAVTHRELVHAIADGISPGTQLSELVKHRNTFVRPDDSIEKASEVMQRKGLSDLAVLDEERALVGVVSMTKIARRQGAAAASPSARGAASK